MEVCRFLLISRCGGRALALSVLELRGGGGFLLCCVAFVFLSCPPLSAMVCILLGACRGGCLVVSLRGGRGGGLVLFVLLLLGGRGRVDQMLERQIFQLCESFSLVVVFKGLVPFLCFFVVPWEEGFRWCPWCALSGLLVDAVRHVVQGAFWHGDIVPWWARLNSILLFFRESSGDSFHRFLKQLNLP